ncbi:MAG: LysR family transcriptional regulator [Tabrizicola sp.]
MDRFEAMAMFQTVAQAGSLSEAGRRLGIPLATVSRRMGDLEARLGARLLIRGSRKVTLTTAGETYLAAARRILDDLAEAERAASGEYAQVQGQLVITAPVVFGRLHLLPVVTAFLRENPDVDVQLTLADRLLHLQDDHVDLALRIGRLPDSALIATRIGEVRQVLCAAPSYLAARGEPRDLAALAQHDCIAFTALGQADRWDFPGAEEASLTLAPRLSVNTAEAALDAAADGLGITRVLSYQMERLEAEGRLRRILTRFEPPPVPIHLVHAAQGLVPRKLRAFLDFAVPRLRARLAPQAQA